MDKRADRIAKIKAQIKELQKELKALKEEEKPFSVEYTITKHWKVRQGLSYDTIEEKTTITKTSHHRSLELAKRYAKDNFINVFKYLVKKGRYSKVEMEVKYFKNGELLDTELYSFEPC